MESVYRMSTFGSSVASDSLPCRSGSTSRKSSKADVAMYVGSPGSEFSEYEMFDELLGLEEDHFSPPESFMGVSTSEELRHAHEIPARSHQHWHLKTQRRKTNSVSRNLSSSLS
ncbi:hypothetical protein OS493_039916 [Desmophyllum pertusum]|uniref:Uncharacterized protein n=1 Tax=Desmophyllum pertusum TaxID=174260 RepID=A0A9W9Z8U6_9CNID|nr:hypothetical protein OS493_039916 [Desmophyllum pertusum]